MMVMMLNRLMLSRPCKGINRVSGASSCLG